MENKRYLDPEMEVITFGEVDVLITSDPVLPDDSQTPFEDKPVPFA